MKSIKILQKYEPYIVGDVIDIDDKLADKLIEDGQAKLYRVVLNSVDIETGGAE